MKLEIISLVIVVSFSMFGMLMAANIIHEMVHREDFKEVATSGEICALVIPQEVGIKDLLTRPLALYSYTYSPADEKEHEEIRKYTELRAYAATFIIAFIFLASFSHLIYRQFFTRKENEYYATVNRIKEFRRNRSLPEAKAI